VGLGPATVVRLEGALAHSEAPGIWYFRLSWFGLSVLPKSVLPKSRADSTRLVTNAALERSSGPGGPENPAVRRRTRAVPAPAVAGSIHHADDTELEARSTEPSATRPSHGTGARRARSNRPARPAAQRRQAGPPPPTWRMGSRQVPNCSVCRPAAENGGPTRRSDTPGATRNLAACGQRLAARPAGLLASRVVGRLPQPSRARSVPLQGGGAHARDRHQNTCVHRLWMTMWTGTVGVGHDGHNERDQGPIRLSPTVILTRSTDR
jgi:hypothetical protein